MSINGSGSVISQFPSFDCSIYLTPPPTYSPSMNTLQSPMYGSQLYAPFQCGYPPYYYGQSSSVYPPLLPCQPQLQQPVFTSSFTVTFITGNITVCFGCKNKLYKKFATT